MFRQVRQGILSFFNDLQIFLMDLAHSDIFSNWVIMLVMIACEELQSKVLKSARKLARYWPRIVISSLSWFKTVSFILEALTMTDGVVVCFSLYISNNSGNAEA